MNGWVKALVSAGVLASVCRNCAHVSLARKGSTMRSCCKFRTMSHQQLSLPTAPHPLKTSAVSAAVSSNRQFKPLLQVRSTRTHCTAGYRTFANRY